MSMSALSLLQEQTARSKLISIKKIQIFNTLNELETV